MEQMHSGIHTEMHMGAGFMPGGAEAMCEIPAPMPMPLPHHGHGEPCGFCITPAMAYVPNQKWTQLYEAEVGFARGTIFPQLDLPFLGEGVRQR